MIGVVQALPETCLRERADMDAATVEWLKARVMVTCHNGMRYFAQHLHPHLTVDDNMPEVLSFSICYLSERLNLG